MAQRLLRQLDPVLPVVTSKHKGEEGASGDGGLLRVNRVPESTEGRLDFYRLRVVRVGTLQRIEAHWSLVSMGSLVGRYRLQADRGRIKKNTSTKLRVFWALSPNSASVQTIVGRKCVKPTN